MARGLVFVRYRNHNCCFQNHKRNGSKMRIYQIIFIFNLLCSTGTCLQNKCLSLEFAIPFSGRYCPGAGVIAAPNLSWDQCKLYCLQKAGCEAVNYNFTTNICIKLPATCPKAINHPGMAFALFTGRQPEQCLEWIPKQDGHPVGDRSVTEDNSRFVARMQKDGSDFVGYLGVTNYQCFSSNDNGEINSLNGYPCQYLRIRNVCTVMYVDYELGTSLPHTAVIGGYTADGIPVYIGIGTYDNKFQLPGYYTPGSMRVVAGFVIVTENVKILVAL